VLSVESPSAFVPTMAIEGKLYKKEAAMLKLLSERPSASGLYQYTQLFRMPRYTPHAASSGKL